MRTRATGKATKPVIEGRPHGFCTFHSLAYSFASLHRDAFPFPLAENFLATPDVQNKFLYFAAKTFHVDFDVLRCTVSKWKRGGLSPASARLHANDDEAIRQASAYSAYACKCKEAGVLDFDSLLMEMESILRENKFLFGEWQYRYLMVDEANDLDEVQIRLCQLLSKTHGNIMLVGDPNQNVYQFRGSVTDALTDFTKYWPTGKYLYLGENFRSSPEIVSFLKATAPIKNELQERMRSNQPSGPTPRYCAYSNNISEAEGVVTELLKKEGTCAVLARCNKQLRPLQDVLAEKDIRYYLLGNSGFYAQTEVRAVMAYVQCVLYPSDVALLRAIRAPFGPSKYLRKKELCDTLQKMQKGDPNKPSLWTLIEAHKVLNTPITQFVNTLHSLSALRNLPAKDAVDRVISQIQAIEHYDEDGTDNSPADNIRELPIIAARFGSLKEFLAHVQKVDAVHRRKKGVALATIHAAKGSEWDHVYVIGAQEGLIPHKNCESVADEEKVMFVANSRAARSLNLSWWGTPSRFIQPYLPKKAEGHKGDR